MSRISIIGGITADIEGNPFGQLIHGDSNPGKISIAYGGVGRNITENLARLGADVAFISATGDDFVGRGAVRELAELGTNVEQVQLLEQENTAMYLSILNIVGEMELALCSMDVLERISSKVLAGAMDSLKQSQIIGMDCNLTEETLEFLTSEITGVPLFLDPASVDNAERAKKIIGKFHTIKPNRMEAEVISGLSILSEDELRAAGDWFCRQGVQRVFISLGGGGVYYKEGGREGILRPVQSAPIRVTGAGEAFSAAILDGFVKGLDVEKTAEYGMAVAQVAMQSKTAVNPKLSEFRFA